jgi:monoamine oxidase
MTTKRNNPKSTAKTHKIKSNRIKEKQKMVYSEFLCVGSGVSNAYACYQLKEKNIHSGKIIILEKSDHYGGRIKSRYTNTVIQNKPEVGYDEFGAMRLFKGDQMKKVFDLIRKFHIKTINVSLEDKDNAFYYKGKKYLKKDARLSSGIKIVDFEKIVKNNIKKQYPDIDFNNIFSYEEFRNLNVKQLLKKYGNATSQDINMWFSYLGHNMYFDNTQATIWLYENIFNRANKDNQYYLLDGMISLVRELFDRSNIKIVYNTTAISVEKDASGYTIVTAINKNNDCVKYKCKYLFIGATATQVLELNSYKPIPISPQRIRAISEITPAPFFKVFLKWDKKNIWWGRKGDKYKTGKSTTDLPIRQIYYYSDEDILIYNSGPYATKLYNNFLENPEKAAIDVYKQIEMVHGTYIPPPNFKYTSYQYWPVGTGMWKIGADVTRNAELIPNGYSDHSNIYIVGDSFSTYQGWIIGAINSVDIALKHFQTIT